MNIEQWVEKHCQCGIDKSGKWSEELFAEFGCTCRDNLTWERRSRRVASDCKSDPKGE